VLAPQQHGNPAIAATHTGLRDLTNALPQCRLLGAAEAIMIRRLGPGAAQQTNVRKPLDTTAEYATANLAPTVQAFVQPAQIEEERDQHSVLRSVSRLLISARCITICSHIAPRWHTREAADPAPLVTRQMRR